MPLVVFFNGTHVTDGVNPSPIDRSYTHATFVLAIISSIVCFTVICSVLWSKKTRVEGFNIYLVFLLVPDVFFNIWCAVISKINLNAGVFPSVSILCVISSITLASYVTANLWMNALVASEVYRMLQHSHQARRFEPSTPCKVMRRVLIVYAASILLSMFLTFNTKPLLDTRLDSNRCNIGFYDSHSLIVGYLLVVTAVVPPSIYLIYVTCVVYKNKLLPPAGTSRFLALFFLRISLAALFLTIMALATVALRSVKLLLPFLVVQGIIVSLLSLGKHDVRAAMMDTLCCYRFTTITDSVENKATASVRRFVRSDLFKNKSNVNLKQQFPEGEL